MTGMLESFFDRSNDSHAHVSGMKILTTSPTILEGSRSQRHFSFRVLNLDDICSFIELAGGYRTYAEPQYYGRVITHLGLMGLGGAWLLSLVLFVRWSMQPRKVYNMFGKRWPPDSSYYLARPCTPLGPSPKTRSETPGLLQIY